MRVSRHININSTLTFWKILPEEHKRSLEPVVAEDQYLLSIVESYNKCSNIFDSSTIKIKAILLSFL